MTVSKYYHDRVKSLNQTLLFLINVQNRYRDEFQQVVDASSLLLILSTVQTFPNKRVGNAIMTHVKTIQFMCKNSNHILVFLISIANIIVCSQNQVTVSGTETKVQFWYWYWHLIKIQKKKIKKRCISTKVCPFLSELYFSPNFQQQYCSTIA